MAFANVLVEKVSLGNGFILERGTWAEDAAGTTGTITADTTQQPEIAEIVGVLAPTSDGDTAVTPAMDGAQNELKLTFTAGDNGTYGFIGKAR